MLGRLYISQKVELYDWKNVVTVGVVVLLFLLGQYTYANGDSYVGDWKEDKWNGVGNPLFTFHDYLNFSLADNCHLFGY